MRGLKLIHVSKRGPWWDINHNWLTHQTTLMQMETTEMNLAEKQKSKTKLYYGMKWKIMMVSSNGNIFRVTGHLCGEPVNSPHKGQWRGALVFTLICARINGWVNNREAGDLRRHRAHYDVIIMIISEWQSFAQRVMSFLESDLLWFIDPLNRRFTTTWKLNASIDNRHLIRGSFHYWESELTFDNLTNLWGLANQKVS